MRTIVILFCLCFGVLGSKPSNETLDTLPTKERNRRLIPYMTYYLTQPQNQPYRAVMAVPYLAVPQYRQPVPQRYIQQPSSLTRMITQNYLALSKLGNPRLQTRLNVNFPQEVKYYVPISTIKGSYEPINDQQHRKYPSTFPYINPQISEQLQKQPEAEYDDQDPHINLKYSKPSADEVIQFAKPEVQQYVTKVTEPILEYTQNHGSEYETGPHTTLPQYFTKHTEPQQYTLKPEDSITYQRQRPIQFAPKDTQAHTNFNTEIADEPDYRGTPSTSNSHLGKGAQTSVSITQSQEIEVEPSPTNPTPTAKYHATYQANPPTYSPYYSYDEEKSEEFDTEILDKNLNDILRGGSLTKTLPEKITSENLGSSIQTLSKILRILQAAHSLPQSAKTIINNFPNPNEARLQEPAVKLLQANKQKDDSGSTPGRPGIDYPVYDEIPETHFSCKEQRYKGFFGDPETRCQVWHYCDLNGGQASFLCPNGTIFSQVALTCDWWFNVKCASTAQLYVLNERLYKFILPQKPSFPEDYSGPLVDRYLTQKFKEIEEKGKNKTEEVKNTDEEFEPPYSIDLVSQNKVRSVG